jgi:tetratricopeptide (TPR) repeat protein
MRRWHRSGTLSSGGLCAVFLLAGCAKSEPDGKTASKPASATSNSAVAGDLALPDIDTSKLPSALQTKLGDARYRARRSPDDAAGVGTLGALCYVHGRPEDAVVCFQRAAQLAPTEPAWWYDLARAYEKKGNKAEATAAYEKLLALKDYAPARARLAALQGSGSPMPASQPGGFGASLAADSDRLEAALLRLGLDVQTTVDAALDAGAHGQFTQAQNMLNDALAIEGSGVRARTGQGLLLNMRGKYDEAIAEFEQVVALPAGRDFVPAKKALVSLLIRFKRIDRAATILRELVTQVPDQADVANSLAWLCATSADAKLRNPDEAIRLAERANALTHGEKHIVLDTLAAAFAAAGRFDDAKKIIAQAIRMADEAKEPGAAAAYRSRQALYEAGTAYREAP